MPYWMGHTETRVGPAQTLFLSFRVFFIFYAMCKVDHKPQDPYYKTVFQPRDQALVSEWHSGKQIAPVAGAVFLHVRSHEIRLPGWCQQADFQRFKLFIQTRALQKNICPGSAHPIDGFVKEFGAKRK